MPEGGVTKPFWTKVILPSPSMEISTVKVVVIDCAFVDCAFHNKQTAMAAVQRYNGLGGRKAPMMIGCQFVPPHDQKRGNLQEQPRNALSSGLGSNLGSNEETRCAYRLCLQFFGRSSRWM